MELLKTPLYIYSWMEMEMENIILVLYVWRAACTLDYSIFYSSLTWATPGFKQQFAQSYRILSVSAKAKWVSNLSW